MAHMTGDYLFQTDYLAKNKGKDWYVLFAHSVLYATGVVLVAYIMKINLNWIWVGFIIFSHFIIDSLKAKKVTVEIMGETQALIVDQILHYYILLYIAFCVK